VLNIFNTRPNVAMTTQSDSSILPNSSVNRTSEESIVTIDVSSSNRDSTSEESLKLLAPSIFATDRSSSSALMDIVASDPTSSSSAISVTPSNGSESSSVETIRSVTSNVNEPKAFTNDSNPTLDLPILQASEAPSIPVEPTFDPNDADDDLPPNLNTKFAWASDLSLSEQRRLLMERISKYESRISLDPWDTEAWTSMIMECQTKHIEVSRDIYERFLKQFPTSGRYWKLYAEHELAFGNFDKVDQIFGRCLLKVPNIDLWKSYVNYIQSTKQNEPNGKEQILQAYEFALEKMGMDISANQIWSDYLSFLKMQKPRNQYEEGQKITNYVKLIKEQ